MLYFGHQRRRALYPKSLQSERLAKAKFDITDYFSRQERERAQTDVPTVWQWPLETDVISGLTTVTHGKCAFCEARTGNLAVYRFRPPSHATNADGAVNKSCYLWLTFNWENLFPICPECLPSSPAYFPVAGSRVSPPDFSNTSIDPLQGAGLDLNERPTFYYPGEMYRPYRYYHIRLDGTLGGGARASATIQHFNLNRPRLVEQRRAVFAATIAALTEKRSDRLWQDETAKLQTEYVGTIYLLLRRIALELGKRLASKAPVAIDRIGATFKTWFGASGYDAALRAAIRVLQAEDARTAPAPASEPAMSASMPAVSLEYPRIHTIRIRNYKSLEDIGFEMADRLPDDDAGKAPSDDFRQHPQAPCLLILGENATGKSSVMEAVALACMKDELRDRLNPSPRRMVLNPEYMGSHGEVEQSQIEVAFHDGSRTTLVIDAKRHGIACARQGDAYPEGHPLVFSYGAHRQFGQDTDDDQVLRIATLFDSGRHIPNPEPWLTELAQKRPAVLDEVVSALRQIIQIDGHFQNIEVRRDPETRKDICVINVERTLPDGTKYVIPQRLSVVSSGYRAIFSFVCHIFQGLLEAADYDARAARRAHAIILVDEIEAHLHPRWKLQVISGLRYALPRATFIVTSHDPLCVRGMFDGEVMMLNRFINHGQIPTSTMREVVEPVANFGPMKTLTIEQLLTSELFQLFSTDDSRTDRKFAGLSELLAKEARDRDTLSMEEREVLSSFRNEIEIALPYGRTEVSRLVEEAIAEYVAERRQLSAQQNLGARKRAKEEIRRHLRDILG